MTDPLDQIRAALADRYRVERELGRGGMATVYLACDLKHDRPVALKVLQPDLAAVIGTDRFLREIRIAASLHHPHILALYDSGEVGGVLYYVMPYAEGESLHDRLGRERQLPIEDAVRIAREVADALSYAHSHDVVHRDIKPENIMLESGHAMVADFGIARAFTAAGGDRITETGLAVGTPAYMSPEQAAGDQIDGRSDIYSLATVLYEMLAGEPPYSGPTAQALIFRRLTEPAPRLATARETVPVALDTAVAKALAKAPADRFSTAAEFAAALSTAGGSAATSPATPVARVTWPRRGWLRAAGVGGAVAVVTLVTLWVTRGSPAPTVAGGRPTLAVLPFENLGSPDDEFFADGITEEMTSRLAQISGLGVISRTSTLRYKGATRSLREVGAELEVEYVLEGTVRTDRRPDGSGQVRVTPQLIRVSDDMHLWTDRYTATLAPGEIFEVQATIAEQVAIALNVALLGSERQALHTVPTTDAGAHEAYLLGRFHWNKRTGDGLGRAVEHFSVATQRDPEFAGAWAGLADAYALLPLYGVTEPSRAEAYRHAAAAARSAMRLDDTLAEAHASLAFALMYGSWDWEAAEREFRRAVELDPEYPVARYWYAELLIVLGRFDEAVEQARRGAQLAPAAPVAQHIYGWSYYMAGDLAEGARYTRRAIELDPGFPFAHNNLGIMHVLSGRLDDAEAELVQGSSGPEGVRIVIGGLRDPTRRDEAIRRVADYQSENPPRDPASGAFPYLLLQVPDSALAWFEKAYQQRTEMLFLLIPDPLADFMRDDTRFGDLIRRVGLDPDSYPTRYTR